MHDGPFRREMASQLSKYGVSASNYTITRVGRGRLPMVRVLYNGRTVEMQFPRHFTAADVHRIVKNKMGNTVSAPG